MLIAEVLKYLQELAPLDLAEDWDNVGLLIGTAQAEVSSIMTCLTLTPDVAEEAIREGADLIVSHHPVLFRAVKQLNDRTAEGRMLLDLIRAGVAVYSPHTCYDSAQAGINRQLAQTCGLRNVRPLRPRAAAVDDAATGSPIGAGRLGELSQPIQLSELVELVKRCLKQPAMQFVGHPDREVSRVGVACGAAAEFMHDAIREGCDVLLTGEARFHACLEARTSGIALILPGHYATERPAMIRMAQFLKGQYPDLNTWASTSEADPIQWA